MKLDYKTMTEEDEIRECAKVSRRLQSKPSIRMVMNELGMDQDDLSQTVYLVYLMTKKDIVRLNLSISTVINRRIIDQFRSLSKGWGSPRKRNKKLRYFSLRPVSKLKEVDASNTRFNINCEPHEKILDMIERDDSILEKTRIELELDMNDKHGF